MGLSTLGCPSGPNGKMEILFIFLPLLPAGAGDESSLDDEILPARFI